MKKEELLRILKDFFKNEPGSIGSVPQEYQHLFPRATSPFRVLSFAAVRMRLLYYMHLSDEEKLPQHSDPLDDPEVMAKELRAERLMDVPLDAIDAKYEKEVDALLVEAKADWTCGDEGSTSDSDESLQEEGPVKLDLECMSAPIALTPQQNKDFLELFGGMPQELALACSDFDLPIVDWCPDPVIDQMTPIAKGSAKKGSPSPVTGSAVTQVEETVELVHTPMEKTANDRAVAQTPLRKKSKRRLDAQTPAEKKAKGPMSASARPLIEFACKV